MHPDPLEQLSQQQLDAWAEQRLLLDQLDDGFDDDGLLDAELAALTADAGGARAVLLTGIADTEQTLRMLQAHQQQQLATLSRLSPFADGEPLPPGAEVLDDDRHAVDAAALETALLFGLAPSTAKARLYAARELVEEHPGVHAALADGRLDGWRAKLIVEALRRLPDETAREVEAQLLSDLPPTAGKLLDRLRRLVIAADPRDAAQRHAEARADRRVTSRGVEDGMGQLFGELPAEGLAIVDQIIDQVADALRDENPNDGRTKQQRRADALVRLCEDVLRTGHTGGCQPGCHHQQPAADDDEADTDDTSDAEHDDDTSGCPDEPVPLLRLRDRVGRPHILVTVSWTTLAGLDDLPATLAGYGPITADQARALAADGVWRRLLTDPASGGLLDYGRTVYPPPRLLQEFVRVRDVTSVFPTDNTPAHRTETDHHLEWERGGPTSATNCGPLTGWINRAKTWYRWSALRLPDGGLRWTSPTGITADRPPTQVGPTDTEAREAAARLRQPTPRRPGPATVLGLVVGATATRFYRWTMCRR